MKPQCFNFKSYSDSLKLKEPVIFKTICKLIINKIFMNVYNLISLEGLRYHALRLPSTSIFLSFSFFRKVTNCVIGNRGLAGLTTTRIMPVLPFS